MRLGLFTLFIFVTSCEESSEVSLTEPECEKSSEVSLTEPEVVAEGVFLGEDFDWDLRGEVAIIYLDSAGKMQWKLLRYSRTVEYKQIPERGDSFRLVETSEGRFLEVVSRAEDAEPPERL